MIITELALYLSLLSLIVGFLLGYTISKILNPQPSKEQKITLRKSELKKSITNGRNPKIPRRKSKPPPPPPPRKITNQGK